jgi:RNA polymerase-interacting CarD/CdnL/TRCF family regulator
MYERAKYFIVSEVAHVKNIIEKDAESLVERAISSAIEKRSRKLQSVN